MLSGEDMRVRDVMRRWFDRLEPDTSVLEAARLMVLTGQQALPVVAGNQLVGMIAERDILARLLSQLSADVYQGLGLVDRDAAGCYHDLCGVPVEELMSRRLVTSTPEMPGLKAVGIMRAHRIQRLPVIDGDELVGLVFQSDIHAALLGMGVRQPSVVRQPL
jgi:CBS domain-containing protein